MRIVIAYGTTDGQTARIAERLAARMRAGGHSVAAVDASTLPRRFDLNGIDAVLVGGSVHVGGFQRSISRFIARQKGALERIPSGFFSVCLAIASKSPAEHEEAWKIVRRYLARQGWRPDATEIFAGALSFSRYGFFRRGIMRSIARKEMGVVDTSRDYELTDWAQVDRFAASFLQMLERRAPPRSAASGGGVERPGDLGVQPVDVRPEL